MVGWLDHYQTLLFDCDGLLVDTEPLHWRAYQNLCANHGYSLPWSFDQYCERVHHSDRGTRSALYEAFPQLQETHPDWSVLYEEKQAIYRDLLDAEPFSLKEGVEEFLKEVDERRWKMAVVTNSRKSQTDRLRQEHPLLNRISHWVTREQYQKSKPDPECYQLALEQLKSSPQGAVGFEDTPRGVEALIGAGVAPILVVPPTYPLREEAVAKGARWIPSLAALLYPS